MKSESEKQKYLLAIFLNLGIKRSYGTLAKLTGYAKSTLNLWAQELDWNSKIREFDAKCLGGSEQQKALDDLIPRFHQAVEMSADPHERIINTLMEQCGLVLQTGFKKDEETGLLVSKVEIKTVKDYVAMLEAIHGLIELIRKDKGGASGGGTGKKPKTNAEKLLRLLGDVDESTQREFITGSHGATIGKRTSGASGMPQEADFKEVPDADAAQD